MSITKNFVSPFSDPASLDVAARHFSEIGMNSGFLKSRCYFFKTIELFGSQYADYCSIINPVLTLDKISETINSRFNRYLVIFRNILGADSSCDIIEEWVGRNCFVCYKRMLSRAPYLDITMSWDGYVAEKRHKFWYNIARAQKLLKSEWGNINFKIINDTTEIRKCLPACMTLYHKNWNRLTSTSFFLTKLGGKFLEDLLVSLSQISKAELCVLEQEGNILAFSVGLKMDSTYYFYIFSTNKENRYRQYSVGKILIRHLLQSVFDRGFSKFDFMAGEEPYKHEWTKLSRERYSYYIVNNRFLDRVMLSLFLSLDRFILSIKNGKKIRRLLGMMSRVKRNVYPKCASA